MSELFIGVITDNHEWKWETPDHWRSFLKTKKPGKYVLRQPTSFKDGRGLNQNALLWARTHQLSDATGYTPAEIHSYIMELAGFIQEKEIFGKIIIDRISSTELSKVEFSKLFIEQDKICNDLNDGRDPESWMALISTDPLV